MPGLKVIIDRAYCDTKDCIHRRGCLRWIGNYTEEERAKARVWMDDSYCMDEGFILLNRFRHSDGWEMLGSNFREETL